MCDAVVLLKKILTNLVSAGAHEPHATLQKAWTVLSRNYGDDSVVSQALLNKLRQFPPIKNTQDLEKMEDLLSLCSVIDSNIGNCAELGIMNLQQGQEMIWQKMPENFCTKWGTECHKLYNRENRKPRFKELIKFFEEYILERSNPVFKNMQSKSYATTSGYNSKPKPLICAATSTTSKHCAYHGKDDHSIHKCKDFLKLSYYEKKKFAIDNKMCTACLGSHKVFKCPRETTCETCNGKHATAMHRGKNFEPSSQQTKQKESTSTSNINYFVIFHKYLQNFRMLLDKFSISDISSKDVDFLQYSPLSLISRVIAHSSDIDLAQLQFMTSKLNIDISLAVTLNVIRPLLFDKTFGTSSLYSNRRNTLLQRQSIDIFSYYQQSKQQSQSISNENVKRYVRRSASFVRRFLNKLDDCQNDVQTFNEHPENFIRTLLTQLLDSIKSKFRK